MGIPQELRDQIYGYLTEDEERIILGQACPIQRLVLEDWKDSDAEVVEQFKAIIQEIQLPLY